jgi:hypothetical protein
LAARLGGTRAGFEAKYGAAARGPNAADAVPYEVPGLGRVGGVYRADRIVRVNLAPDRPCGKPQHEPDAADWTLDAAHEAPRRFLPADAVIRGSVRAGRVTPCRSAALARVLGAPGACRYAFKPTADGRVAAIAVAIVDRRADRDGGWKPRDDPGE